LVALMTAPCWAYPRVALVEVFTNYG